MSVEIVKQVAHFLEACPKQVQNFDKKFLKHLMNHPAAWHDFCAGSETARWDIYREVKYKM